MARLFQASAGRSVSLAARTLIGRSSASSLRIRDARVSGEHAAIHWQQGESWVLRDLVSRNGTFVDGGKVASGRQVSLSLGMRLQFGGAGQPVWEVQDLAAPQPEARRLYDGLVRSDPQFLALPDDEDPRAVVLLGPSGWVVEQGEESRPVSDQELIDVGGDTWQLALPVDIGRTAEATVTKAQPRGYGLHFKVSMDQEYIELSVETDLGPHALKPRSHHYMLLVLSRLRMEESALPEGERGWIYASDLAHQLRMDRRTLNVHLHRSRKEMAGLGVPGRVVERRASTNQVRIGTPRLSIEAV